VLRKLAAIRSLPGYSAKRIGLLVGLFCIVSVFEIVGVTLLIPIAEIWLAGSGGDDVTASLAVLSTFVDIDHIYQSYGLAGLVMLSLASLMGRVVSKYGAALYQAKTIQRILTRTRSEYLSRSLQVSLEYQSTQSTGASLNTLMQEANRTVVAVEGIVAAASVVPVLLFYGFLLGTDHGALFASSFVVAVALIPILRVILARTGEASRQATRANRNVLSQTQERWKNLRLLKLSNSTEDEVSQASTLFGVQFEKSFAISRISALTQFGYEVILIFSAAGMAVFAIVALESSAAGFLIFGVLAMRFIGLLRSVVGQLQRVFGVLGSLSDVSSELALSKQHQEPPAGNSVFQALREGIVLENVWYDHGAALHTEGRGPVLRGISIEIRKGQITAFVGPSGAGKSTLLDLLPRLRCPTSGIILFDGKPVEDIDIASLRQEFAYVPQSPQFLVGTVADHIRFGNDSISDEDIRSAACQANIADMIESLPNGYSTELGEAGALMSGGQRQRLDIARALAQGASILLLDEPTSALDVESESSFREMLLGLRENTDLTIVVVAHRLSSIQDADQIVVLQEGRVEQAGNHAHLIERGGWYAGMSESMATA